MFGTYRILLALLVVAHHLLKIPVIGPYAVHGFFILSGYLMTYIMHHSYGYNSRGRLNFAINRFLRLIPTYWFILLLSALIVIYYGETNSIAYRYFIYLPSTLKDLFQNVFLIYLDWMPSKVSPRLSPPTWALTVELFFYLLIALGISKSKKATIIWISLGILYYAGTYILQLDRTYRYSVIFAGSLPFSIGALIYHFKEPLLGYVERHARILNFYSLLTAFILNSILATQAGKHHIPFLENICMYTNYLINALLIIYLIKGRPPLITKKMDKIIGDYSYPLYLFHWQAGFAISMMLWDKPIISRDIAGLINFFLALVLTILVSFVAIKFIDGPIERYRRVIREKNKTNANKHLNEHAN